MYGPCQRLSVEPHTVHPWTSVHSPDQPEIAEMHLPLIGPTTSHRNDYILSPMPLETNVFVEIKTWRDLFLTYVGKYTWGRDRAGGGVEGGIINAPSLQYHGVPRPYVHY